MRHQLFIISILLVITGLTACHKEQGNNQNNSLCSNETYLDSFAKKLFFSINSNSYWIYKDSLGNIDSSWVSNSFDGPVIPGCAEQYQYNLSSSVLYNDFNINGAVSKGTPTQVYIIYDFANSGGRGGDDCFQILFLNGAIATGYDTLYPSITVEQLPMYTVNQFSFSNAVKITSTSGCFVHYIVVVPGIGIVEKWNGQGISAYKVIRYSI